MLEITDLTIQINTRGVRNTVVNNLNLSMREGECVGIVGESGSGKTMTALAVMGLLPVQAQAAAGTIIFQGRDLLTGTKKELQHIQGAGIGMIFQEPMTALNPVMRVGKQVEEALRVHTGMKPQERQQKALHLLREVEFAEPEKVYRMYPHQLSGGMRQRIMIAAALICEPKLLIADEPTTALDVTIQRQILELLLKLNKKYNTAILFISHDLGVVRKVCHKVMVMQQGQVVEAGNIEEVFRQPAHAYTKKLIASVPRRRAGRTPDKGGTANE